MKNILLENHLLPLKKWLEQSDVNEISVNRPGEIWVERQGIIEREVVAELTLRHLKDLAKLIATDSEQILCAEHPLLSATLPQGHRVQIVYPPAVSENTVGISIRKPSIVEVDLSCYTQQSSVSLLENGKKSAKNNQAKLLQLHKNCQYYEFLKLAIEERRNILISGGTSTGKTTFLNALIKNIPETERIITIEDVPEIKVNQPNSLSLFACRGRQGRAQIDVQDLVEASLRLRPDRIIIGELRGAEAFSFLRAVNTGHPGSMATLHADTPLLALEQLVLMVMQKNLGLSREQIENYIHLVIDIVVQLKKGNHGLRYISEIHLMHSSF